jgi:hypothetical protein
MLGRRAGWGPAREGGPQFAHQILS